MLTILFKVMPGDNVELLGDLVHDVAMEKGSRFTLREGGKTSMFFNCFQEAIPDELSSWHWFGHRDLRVKRGRLVFSFVLTPCFCSCA